MILQILALKKGKEAAGHNVSLISRCGDIDNLLIPFRYEVGPNDAIEFPLFQRGECDNMLQTGAQRVN